MLGFSACDKDETDSNPFVGTWVGGMGTSTFEITFTETAFTTVETTTFDGKIEKITTNGTYSYKNSMLTTVVDGEQYTVRYELVNNTLTLHDTDEDGKPLVIVLTKK